MPELVPPPHDILASDPEREVVADALRAAGVEGRLDAVELEERLGAAYGARTRADLLPLLADLPQPAPQPPKGKSKSDAEPPWFAPVIPLAILLVAIWALTGAGYFWPMWPIGFVLLASLKQLHCGAHGRRASG
ncbi:MAG TPA: DUF1707 domain-containing protein [Solirubrobacteraceae bacterium]|nr:DUF1707 domain-containing protein [Solirubrobacteraceae bacterium]